MTHSIRISEAELRRLQATVAMLDDRLPAVVRCAYDRFAEHPDTRPEFLANREKRESVLVEFLRGGVLGAIRSGDLAPLVPRFERLGIIHASLGMTDDLLGVAGVIFVSAMESVCGSSWTPDFSRAWRALFEQTGRIMVETAQAARDEDEATRPLHRSLSSER